MVVGFVACGDDNKDDDGDGGAKYDGGAQAFNPLCGFE